MAENKSFLSNLWKFNLFSVKFVGLLTIGLWIAFFHNYNLTKEFNPNAGIGESVGSWYVNTAFQLPTAIDGFVYFLTDLFNLTTDYIVPGAGTVLETIIDNLDLN